MSKNRDLPILKEVVLLTHRECLFKKFGSLLRAGSGQRYAPGLHLSITLGLKPRMIDRGLLLLGKSDAASQEQ
jgi:hypothetical protein